MKLSEAIRLGSMATVQGFGGASILSNDAPCALGAARLAIGGRAWCQLEAYDIIYRSFPISEREMPMPSELQEKYGKVSRISRTIWLLNDICKWSREAIADWVETIEAEACAEELQAVPISAKPSMVEPCSK